MLWACSLALTMAAYPLFRAWRANRQTPLLQSVLWAAGAWVCWLLVFAGAALGHEDEIAFGRYLALSLTGCAAVAVLGARRPGVRAWNFVVCGLLAVLLLPVAEGLGRPRLDAPHFVFLGGTLAVGLVNYLPTRLGLAAVFVAAGCALQLAVLVSPEGAAWRKVAAALCVAAAPWAGLLAVRRPPSANEVDVLWWDFRDRFGVAWGQRTREQFNRAAANAGWPVTLTWYGLEVEGEESPEAGVMAETLRALLRRFGPEGE